MRLFEDYWEFNFSVYVVSEMTYTVSSGTLNSTIPYHFQFTNSYLLCLRPHRAEALSDDARLTSDNVWRLSVSVASIGPKSRTERPRKTKIGTEVAHVTLDSSTTFKVKRSKFNLQRTKAYFGGLPHSLFQQKVRPAWHDNDVTNNFNVLVFATVIETVLLCCAARTSFRFFVFLL